MISKSYSAPKQWLLLCTIFCAVLLPSRTARATHLIGGEIIYEYVGNNEYLITLKVYRDCSSTTPFDDPANLGIFTSSGQLFTLVQMQNPAITQILYNNNDPCLVPPSNVCVEEGIYQEVVSLLPTSGGYDLVYQRCCRNGTIVNVVLPGDVGSTYFAHVPGSNQATNNSSPDFIDFPPIFICVNAPLNLDHSAIDADGDSLVYELCHPFDGASPMDPAPGQPDPPPFNLIPWLWPFNTQDPLGGAPLEIDSATGLLTGTPNSLGQYVVGICVSEYRNGILLNTTKRDFQFNVVNCQAPIAAIPTPLTDPVTGLGLWVNCTSFQVDFVNNSFNTNNYFWDFGDTTTLADTSHLFEPTYLYPDTGAYIVTLISSQGNGCADTTQVIIRMFPGFNTDFGYNEVCADSFISFQDQTVTTYGQVNAWNWDFGDGSVDTINQHPDHTYANAGTYNVTLISTTDRGCQEQHDHQITVHPLPIVNFNYTPPCINSPVTFTDQSSVPPDQLSGWQWDFGNGDTSILQNDNTTYTSTGSFDVSLIVTSDFGCVVTLEQTITVNPLPTVVTSPDTMVCPGYLFNVSASGGNVFAWSPGQIFNNPSLSSPLGSVWQDTTVVVTVMDANQCIDTGSVNISLFPLPPADAGLDTFVCLEDTTQLQASGGVQFNWTPANFLSDPTSPDPLAFPADTTMFYVTVTDTNLCAFTDSVLVDVHNPIINPIVPDEVEICIFDSVDILAAGGTDYLWSPTNTLSDPTIPKPTFFPQTTTIYNVVMSNYCFSGVDTVTVWVNPLPFVEAGTDTNICLSDVIQLNASGGINYNWTPSLGLNDTTISNPIASPDTTTQYLVTVEDTNTCINSDSITIFVYPPPIAYAGEDTTMCPGDVAQLNATGGDFYSWSPSSNLSCSNCPSPQASPVDSTQYIVMVWEIPGCDRTDTVNIHVQQPIITPVPQFHEICFGDTITLDVFVAEALTYTWNPGTGLSESTTHNPQAFPETSTNYRVELSNDCFTEYADVSIHVNQLPPAEAGPHHHIYRDETAILAASGGQDYLWSPSAGLSDSTTANPSASPFNTTIYTVQVTDHNGCIAYDTVTVNIEPLDLLVIPSGFSPNGDGLNDLFHILRYLNMDELISFQVYNRWGQVVWETANLDDRGWNGTMNGEKQPLGAYTWLIQARNKDGESISRSGSITLVR